MGFLPLLVCTFAGFAALATATVSISPQAASAQTKTPTSFTNCTEQFFTDLLDVASGNDDMYSEVYLQYTLPSWPIATAILKLFAYDEYGSSRNEDLMTVERLDQVELSQQNCQFCPSSSPRDPFVTDAVTYEIFELFNVTEDAQYAQRNGDSIVAFRIRTRHPDEWFLVNATHSSLTVDSPPAEEPIVVHLDTPGWRGNVTSSSTETTYFSVHLPSAPSHTLVASDEIYIFVNCTNSSSPLQFFADTVAHLGAGVRPTPSNTAYKATIDCDPTADALFLLYLRDSDVAEPLPSPYTIEVGIETSANNVVEVDFIYAIGKYHPGTTPRQPISTSFPATPNGVPEWWNETECSSTVITSTMMPTNASISPTPTNVTFVDTTTNENEPTSAPDFSGVQVARASVVGGAGFVLCLLMA